MKINRQINECHCDNCRKYEECQAKGVFDDDPGFDFCEFKEDYMSKVETLRVLHHFQKWRRGGRGKMPHPFVLGQAIDSAIRTLRRITKDAPKF